MFKIILWDIDNTLLDFNAAEAYSLKRRFEEFSLGECSDDAVARYNKINIKYWEMLEKGEMAKSEILEARFKEFFSTENIAFNRVKEFNEAYENGIADKIFFNENGFEIVESLKGKYLQYAVTNGSYSVQSVRLEKSGFERLFDGVFISDSVGYEKPSKEFFSYVLSHIPPVDRSEVLIVGDSLTSDMLGGYNAGIKCCWYNPQKNVNSKGIKIDYEILRLGEIFDVLEN